MTSSELRQPTTATAVVFFVTATVSATWATRIPAVRERLDLSVVELTAVVAGLEAGAVAGLPAGAVIVARLGSRRATAAGLAVFGAALCGAGVAPGPAPFVAAVAVFAAANSVVDVAMNVQGVELERRSGRPVLPALHAAHSFGLVGGGLAGTAAAAAALDVRQHFLVTAGGCLFAGAIAVRRFVTELRTATRKVFGRPSRALGVLGAIAFCAFLIDGTAFQWSAVHLRADQDADAGVAAAAFTVFSLGMAGGRLAAGRLLRRFGRAGVVRGAGLLVVAGTALAVATPLAVVSLAGWGVVGMGVAVVAPVVMAAAPVASGLPAPVAIAAVTTVGYLGSFTGPLIVGALAGLGGLALALWVVAAAGGAMALISPFMESRQRGPARSG
ncbi:MFS transporter [Jiangella aurantiaca]|uniref:MFS transporter n=1 Tax=Jiangella aurantiaca TaxID=2530373 RepID=A0A4R5ACV7_9ACTN|nr:MFS transporter [Jiangella aurantiaca]TDD68909.1 MFS transporter [Jiangella aurantiaca]